MMNPEWNWVAFFQQEPTPTFLLTREVDCQQLLHLSFEQGLSVIVCSVADMPLGQWVAMSGYLRQLSDTRVAGWCEIGDAMLDLRQDVQDILQYHSVAQALRIAEDALQTDNLSEQIAFMACLYHERHTQVKARMLFTYLLQHHDRVAQQLGRIRSFLLGLTPRQREVAIRVGQGYTNFEIAQILHVKPETVAEYLTTVYADFGEALQIETDTHGLRYRLIHWLTRLFETHPDLLLA